MKCDDARLLQQGVAVVKVPLFLWCGSLRGGWSSVRASAAAAILSPVSAPRRPIASSKSRPDDARFCELGLDRTRLCPGGAEAKVYALM